MKKKIESILVIIFASEIIYHFIFLISILIASYIMFDWRFDDVNRVLFQEKSNNAQFFRFSYLCLKIPVYALGIELNKHFEFRLWSKNND